MADTPAKCPKCKIAWGVEKVAEPKAAVDGRPAVGPRYKCAACYHRWEVLD